MKAKLLINRYHKTIYIVLVCLVCVIGFRYYKHISRSEIEVYDLTWPDKSDSNDSGEEGDVVYRRWRYFLKTKTHLPRKIEKYSKTDPDDSYVLQETYIITYPTEDNIQQIKYMVFPSN